jgi:hypothetical protein
VTTEFPDKGTREDDGPNPEDRRREESAIRYPIHSEAAKAKPRGSDLLRGFSSLQSEVELLGTNRHKAIAFLQPRFEPGFPMAAAASMSAVTASFTTLSLHKSSNSSAKATSVALPAFHGLKAAALSGASPADLHERVASQCVAASASSSGGRGVVSMVATTKQFVTTKSEETFTAAKVSGC